MSSHLFDGAFFIWIWTIGVSCRRREGAISNPEYRWRSVLCIMLIDGVV